MIAYFADVDGSRTAAGFALASRIDGKDSELVVSVLDQASNSELALGNVVLVCTSPASTSNAASLDDVARDF